MIELKILIDEELDKDIDDVVRLYNQFYAKHGLEYRLDKFSFMGSCLLESVKEKKKLFIW